jgi:acyl-CoA synthetase (AMP-forming)/AMP-acid ligase II
MRSKTRERTVEKVWLKSYPEGVPEDVPAPPWRSVRDLFEHGFAAYPDRPAYTNMGTTLTYSDLNAQSMRFACFLQQTLGLTRGERVAIMLPNILQYPVAMCGIFRAGLVVVNVNPMYTARELRHQLKDSGARAIVILENFAHTLEEVIADTDVDHVVTTGIGDLLNWPKGPITNLVMRYIKKAVPPYRFANRTPLRKALKLGARERLEVVELGYADIAYLQYTGGTTGVSKGAMLSHRNMVFNVQQTITWQHDVYEDVERVIAITALPLYHIFSLEGNCLTGMALGGENVLITNPRDFEGFAKEIAQFDFNLFTGVNTIFASLMNTPSFDKIDFSHLRVSIGGGMAVQPAIAKEWKQKTGQSILQGYGLTETSPVAICCKVRSDFTGTIGLPRDLHQGPAGHGGLLAAPEGHRGGHVTGRLAAHGRCRAHGRGRLLLDRRPQERHDSRIGIQRLPERNRKCRRRTRWRARGGGYRYRRRAFGRSRQGLCSTQGQLSDGTGYSRLLQREPDGLQAAQVYRVPRRAAEDQRWQDSETSSARLKAEVGTCYCVSPAGRDRYQI